MADTADAIFDSAAGDILDALGKSASFIPRAGEPATLVVFAPGMGNWPLLLTCRSINC